MILCCEVCVPTDYISDLTLGQKWRICLNSWHTLWQPLWHTLWHTLYLCRDDLLLFGLEAWRIAVRRLYCLSRRCLNRSLRLTWRVSWLMLYAIWVSNWRHCCRSSLKPRVNFRKMYILRLKIQSNLCTTTTLDTLSLWPLLTGSRCSGVALCYKKWKRDPEMAVFVGRWSLFGNGR